MEQAQPTRVREIDDGFGARVRLSASGPRALLWLERLDAGPAVRVDLDLGAADMLANYLLAARVAGCADQPPESVGVLTPVTMAVVRAPEGAVRLRGGAGTLDIPGGLWDRLFAELKLALASVRSFWTSPSAAVH